jgi:hypothetical protein
MPYFELANRLLPIATEIAGVQFFAREVTERRLQRLTIAAYASQSESRSIDGTFG